MPLEKLVIWLLHIKSATEQQSADTHFSLTAICICILIYLSIIISSAARYCIIIHSNFRITNRYLRLKKKTKERKKKTTLAHTHKIPNEYSVVCKSCFKPTGPRTIKHMNYCHCATRGGDFSLCVHASVATELGGQSRDPCLQHVARVK